jgi:hypothetical protein
LTLADLRALLRLSFDPALSLAFRLPELVDEEEVMVEEEDMLADTTLSTTW